VKLPHPFYRLLLRLDVERLRAEVAAVPESAWAPHPAGLAGNSSVRLIAADGGENDEVDGEMLPTRHLEAMPYVRQVLASFGVVWSRSRLMRLAPRSSVPEHSDINHHWFKRVRLHMPVTTHPDVAFYCGGECVHMAAGEVWLFDNWRLHRVENPSASERIHLVADTSGSAAFWRFVAAHAGATPRELRYDPGTHSAILTERAHRSTVMPAAEVDLLIADLQADLADPGDRDGRARLERYVGVLEALRHDWRQLLALYGETDRGVAECKRLRDSVREVSSQLAPGLTMSSNGIAAQRVFEARVLQHLVFERRTVGRAHAARATEVATVAARRPVRPVFIVAAPRSGSTLLYETLAVSPQFWTLGGEAHWLVESHPELRPGAPNVESNRLTAAECTDTIAARILAAIGARGVTASGAPIDDIERLQLLEKTPKNSLRIPFFDHLCPDARFIFLWRDPRENIASIIEAWQDGRWTTYATLPGWQGPWSLLLPPGWASLHGREMADVAAYQWETTNRIVLDDLARLSRDRWCTCNYTALVQSPAETIRRLCAWLEIDFDAELAVRVGAPLPLSRYTQTPPAPSKWRRHESAIKRVLPGVEATWRRLEAL